MSPWPSFLLIICSWVFLGVAGRWHRDLPSPKKELYALRNSLIVAALLVWSLYIMAPTFYHYLPEPVAEGDLHQLRNAINAQRTVLEGVSKDLDDFHRTGMFVLLATIGTVFHPIYAFARAVAKEPPDEIDPPTITLGINNYDKHE